MKSLIVFATLALTAATAVAAPKDGPRPQTPARHEPSELIVRIIMNQKVVEKIGLSEEQKAKLKEVVKSDRAESEPLRQALKASMERQAELLKAEKIDEAAVMAEIDKAFEARKAMAKLQTKKVIGVKSILTPEQVQKALEEFKNMPKRGRGKPEAKGKGPQEKEPKADQPCPSKD